MNTSKVDELLAILRSKSEKHYLTILDPPGIVTRQTA
jgi:hypothetical protein